MPGAKDILEHQPSMAARRPPRLLPRVAVLAWLLVGALGGDLGEFVQVVCELVGGVDPGEVVPQQGVHLMHVGGVGGAVGGAVRSVVRGAVVGDVGSVEVPSEATSEARAAIQAALYRWQSASASWSARRMAKRRRCRR